MSDAQFTLFACPNCSNVIDGKAGSDDVFSVVHESVRVQMAICSKCQHLLQQRPEGWKDLSQFVARVGMGDDRAMRAVSPSHVVRGRNVSEIYEQTALAVHYELSASAGAISTILAQVENRIRSAIDNFSEMGFVSDKADAGLALLREAVDMISIAPSRFRGITEQKE